MFLRTRQAESPVTIPSPGVSYDTFIGLVWSGAGLSLVAVLLRLLSRARGQGRLFWDDFFVICAEVLVIVTTGLWQWAAKYMYYVLDVESGKATIGPDLLPDLVNWLHVQLIAELFFYTGLLLVKLSFLFFFRRLGRNVTGQRYIWWGSLAFSLVVYIISVGNVQYKCYSSSPEVVQAICTTPEANDFTMATLRANMALDVFSDFLIMLIPITMLWNVRLPPNKKLAFVGLFSLSIVTMIIAIVRAVNVNSSRAGNGQDDATFLWLWSEIQSSLGLFPAAIVIACLSAFPQLFAPSINKRKPVWTPTDSYYQRLKARTSGKSKKTDPHHQLSTISGNDDKVRKTSAASQDSQRPWLGPGWDMQKPAIAYHGAAENQETVVPRGDQIQQHFEYRVTRHEGPWQCTEHE